ncbi:MULTISPECIES: phosphoribosylformylglycinamidine cyclo-ligase [unclassified Clostridioides]|uniref:phosphoribosylformylglycinamidine cyclo-ligase n=1 Tax=unclassified Clostridioides TaxID=2635829 RepID=UPI001D12DEA0|nr:phosphoribosylformylglycinamidine cyclo-ligase [Clostridioides sp. ZZV14-6150]MCC0718098.1 phosphoribosylformylglycinamidine cyclo-ligase [Clostridioides sp. ZZV14-6105]MCC0722514.1 phosphoribosylformylglycinamidine cyclo-ligase [Clostridioides sp. ZZV14-6104]MCC0729911.1 phosphoribosylformylglycinamidine cyclo-ligase [Clostridioides sp. ZZV14-6048]MCC0734793.1 phosphoribosylformylglycinamidine cyclo-ligase [Clostridioides sp. ZZV14-6009]MCC0743347.1 phosphoribosylformylglycinamidine cyclo-
MLTYKESGVDIDEGNRAVDLIKGKIKGTYDGNVVGDLGNFSGLYSLKDFVGMKEPVLLASTDGVGTKLKIAQMMDKHDTVGIDLVAMCVNDLICQGAKPLFFLDYIALGKLVPEHIEKVVGGIADGCKMSGCALIGGETAEMPGMYGDDDYDLAGFSVGIADKEKIVSGNDVKSGDVLVGISSSGVHSNGFSFIRKIFLETYDYKMEQYVEELGMTVGEALLTPTKIYVKLALDVLAKHDIKAIAHITGGGLIENITRVIPKRLGLDINKKSWEKPPIFKMIEGFNAVDERELHKSFNMGIGLVLIVDKENANDVVNFINNRENDNASYVDKKYSELLEDKAYIIGEVVDSHEGVELC